MKKHFSLMAVAMCAVALFGLASCQKEDYSDALFIATIEKTTHQDKTSMATSGTTRAMTWRANDQIAVYDVYEEATATTPCVLSTQSTGATANFNSVVSGSIRSGATAFYAVYPADFDGGAYNYVVLPATQTYHEAGSGIVQFDAPMYAYAQATSQSETVNLAFKNLCGVVQLNLTGLTSEKTISKIMVGSNEDICGKFTVSWDETESIPTMTHQTVTGQNDKVMSLDCGNGVVCGTGTTETSFYIYLPAQNYSSGLQFTLFATDGSHCSVKLNANNFTVTRSMIHPIVLSNPPFDHPSGGRGLFTVRLADPANNITAKQVYFSPGNLQYQASTHTWRFAQHQYDFVGGGIYGDVYVGGVKCDNALISDSYTGWIDLFGWGTGTNPTATTNAGPLWNHFDEYVYLNYNEWGNNVSSSDETWYTLTKDEWNCLFNQRNEYQNKVGTGQVRIGSRNPEDYIHGLIILPDNWSTPTGIGISYESWWQDNTTTNIFSPIEWELMEANGAVFLPEAGRRSATVVGMQSAGYYWSSTGDNTDGWPGQAYYVVVDGSGTNRADIQKDNRGYGASVRLVKDAPNTNSGSGGKSSKSNIIYFGQ